VDRDKLVAQMQKKREELEQLLMLPGKTFFDPEVMRVSRELDELIMEYFRLGR
jgi:hypothetical protein